MSFSENNVDGVIYMTAGNIKTTHAFTTRFGGVSSGAFESLNLGLNLGDSPDNVKKNYELVSEALKISPGSFVRSNQVHGTDIRVVTRADCCAPNAFGPPALCPLSPPPRAADGLVTRDRCVALTIFTADCVPILLHDPVRSVIGAVHAGWRGTAADIAGAAVRKMAGEFSCRPADITAAVGPAISVCCYDTDSDVADALRAALGDSAEYCIAPRSNKYMINLKEANRILLVKAGLRSIFVSDECTSCQSGKYWSHRRTKGVRGSQAAIIALERIQ